MSKKKESQEWTNDELTQKLKKARKKIKKLEAMFEGVNASYDLLSAEHAATVKKIETLDTRTQRMGMALRECMKKLGIQRPG